MIVRKIASTLARPNPTPTLQFNEVRATNPDRTEVYDSLGGWLATFTDGAKSVILKGRQRAFRQLTLLPSDTFNRTRSGWGALTNNGSWSLSGGASSSNSAVTPGAGAMNVTSTATSYRATVVTHAFQDVDIQAYCKTDKLAAGGPHAAGLIMGYQDTDNHYIARVTFRSAVVTDSFTRVTANGWGNASNDDSWSVSGTASDYNTNGTTGNHSVGSLNSSRRTTIGSGTNFDVKAKVATSVFASGASLNAGLLGRYIDGNNHYIFRLRFSPTQTVHAVIQKQVSGTITTIGSETTLSGLTHAAGTYYWMRARAVGSTLEMKVWQDGSSEPAGWDISLTDTSITSAGACGMRSLVNTGSTNTLPVVFSYDDYSCEFDSQTGDTVSIRLLRQSSGSLFSLTAETTISGLIRQVTDVFRLRATMSGGILQAKVWKDGGVEPAWQVTAADSIFTTGRVGVRAIANSGTTNIPILFTWSNFTCQGTWTNPPTVTHDRWIRLLAAPFAGTVNAAWLQEQLTNATPDVLEVAMQYIAGALPVVDTSAIQFVGASEYGPLQSNGSRQEGADFNDYLGIPWTYTGQDQPEPDEFRSLDCSGFVRMVFGYRLGLPLSLNFTDGLRIPRITANITASGPGILVIPHSGSNPPAGSELSKILPGDIVCFDADTSNPEEPEGQIDHIGIYLGQDLEGRHRFISSRKTANGPTFTDIGGNSTVADSGLYTQSFRAIRRF